MNHHAYFILGNEGHIAVLKEYLLTQHDIAHDTCDMSVESFTHMRVEDARMIATRLTRKAMGSLRVYIIYTETLGVDAQHTLLKTLEEPLVNTHIFLIVRARDMLIPTILSRMEELVLEDAQKEKETPFISQDKKTRTDSIKKLHEDLKDNKTTIISAQQLLSQIERELYADGVEKNADILSEVLKAKQALYGKGISPKIILEHINTLLG